MPETVTIVLATAAPLLSSRRMTATAFCVPVSAGGEIALPPAILQESEIEALPELPEPLPPPVPPPLPLPPPKPDDPARTTATAARRQSRELNRMTRTSPVS